MFEDIKHFSLSNGEGAGAATTSSLDLFELHIVSVTENKKHYIDYFCPILSLKQ